MYPDRNVIVVGVDGSPTATAAVRWAAAEAERRHTVLQLLQAYTVPVYYAGPSMYVPMSLGADVREWCEKSVEKIARTIREQHPGLEVSSSVVEDPPWVALQQASEKADLMVVGSHSSSAVGAALLGSVAVKLAAHAHCPVAVVKTAKDGGAPEHPDGPILVCVDDAVDPDALVPFAFDEAERRGVDLVALHLWDDRFPPGFAWPYSEEDERARDADEVRRLTLRLAPWRDKYPGVTVRHYARSGSPRTGIKRWIDQAGIKDRPALIVVGSRGLGAVTGLMLGSTSHAVLARADCPVVIIGHHPERGHQD